MAFNVNFALSALLVIDESIPGALPQAFNFAPSALNQCRMVLIRINDIRRDSNEEVRTNLL